jgi:hypothetical protein
MSISKHSLPILAILVTTVVVFSGGCDFFSDSSDDLGPLEGKVILTVDEFCPWNIGSPQEPELAIVLSTEKIYSNGNNSIITTSVIGDQFGNNISIDIHGIYHPPIATTDIGPALSFEYFDLDNGEYVIGFSYLGKTDYAHLTITDSSFHLTQASDMELVISEEILHWRRPPHSFSYSYRIAPAGQTDYEWAYIEFLNLMIQNIGIEEFTFSENGISPYEKSDEYSVRRFFRYNSESEITQILELANSYQDTISIPQGENISASILTWQGEYFSIFE